MHSSIPTTSCAYSFLYFGKFIGQEKQLVDLASFLVSLDSKNHFLGFDRSLWSGLSSGQMPSQLYTFNFYGSENACPVDEGLLLIISKSKLEGIPDYLETVHSLTLTDDELNEGEMAEAFEEDEEFAGCSYSACLIWKSFLNERPLVDHVRNVWLKANDAEVQLLFGESLFAQDEWVESYFNDESFNSSNKVMSAVHLLIPSPEKLQELEESVLDKERIHLDPEIKGIYC